MKADSIHTAIFAISFSVPSSHILPPRFKPRSSSSDSDIPFWSIVVLIISAYAAYSNVVAEWHELIIKVGKLNFYASLSWSESNVAVAPLPVHLLLLNLRQDLNHLLHNP